METNNQHRICSLPLQINRACNSQGRNRVRRTQVRSLTHAARSQAEIVVVVAAIIIFLWPRFYELSKAALSTRCIHKLVRIGRLVSSLLEFWRPF